MAWRRFSEWSARPKAPASPEVVNARVSTWPSNWPTWALGSTSAHVLRLILLSVCRTSGQARRSTSTSLLAFGAGTLRSATGWPASGRRGVRAAATGSTGAGAEGPDAAAGAAGACGKAASGTAGCGPAGRDGAGPDALRFAACDSSTGQSVVETRGGVRDSRAGASGAAGCSGADAAGAGAGVSDVALGTAAGARDAAGAAAGTGDAAGAGTAAGTGAEGAGAEDAVAAAAGVPTSFPP
ncbi:hypothetical protein D9M72_451380 [compost metagenome]